MHNFMAVAIVARFILSTVYCRGAIASAPGAETNNLGQADATFLHTDEDELLAAIVSARISDPDQVTGVLDELRVESTGVATTAIRDFGGSLDFIRIFLYKKQLNHFHTVLLYNRGTEPQIILFYHPGEVQVPQVPRM